MKKKNILKIVFGGGPILSVLGIIVYIQISIKKDAYRFYKNSTSSIVINKSMDWLTGRANAFHLSDDLKIFLSFDKEEQISVGDSIFKKPNTYIYDVYKKNDNGSYEYSGTYNYNNVY